MGQANKDVEAMPVGGGALGAHYSDLRLEEGKVASAGGEYTNGVHRGASFGPEGMTISVEVRARKTLRRSHRAFVAVRGAPTYVWSPFR
jgi:hypothetical protein